MLKAYPNPKESQVPAHSKNKRVSRTTSISMIKLSIIIADSCSRYMYIQSYRECLKKPTVCAAQPTLDMGQRANLTGSRVQRVRRARDTPQGCCRVIVYHVPPTTAYDFTRKGRRSLISAACKLVTSRSAHSALECKHAHGQPQA